MNSAALLLICQSFLICFMYFIMQLCNLCFHICIYMCKYKKTLFFYYRGQYQLEFCCLLWGEAKSLFVSGKCFFTWTESLCHTWYSSEGRSTPQITHSQRRQLCKVIVFSTSHSGFWHLFYSNIVLLKNTYETAGQIGKNSSFKYEKSLPLLGSSLQNIRWNIFIMIPNRIYHFFAIQTRTRPKTRDRRENKRTNVREKEASGNQQRTQRGNRKCCREK